MKRYCFGLLLFALRLSPAEGPTVPVQLVGDWRFTSTSNVQFTDHAGGYASPSGTARAYHIFPNGQFREEVMIQSSLYSCTDTVFITEFGRVVLRGGTLTFDTRGGDLERKDNYRKSFNYTKTIPARQYFHPSWRVDRDRWGTRFCLTREGKETCYYRK